MDHNIVRGLEEVMQLAGSQRAFLGPATPAEVKQAEEVLGFRFPDSYRAFLLANRQGEFCGHYIHGLSPALQPTMGWNIVTINEKLRRQGAIPANFMCFVEDDEAYICLDFATSGDEPQVVSLGLGYPNILRLEVLANSFFEFLTSVALDSQTHKAEHD